MKPFLFTSLQIVDQSFLIYLMPLVEIAHLVVCASVIQQQKFRVRVQICLDELQLSVMSDLGSYELSQHTSTEEEAAVETWSPIQMYLQQQVHIL